MTPEMEKVKNYAVEFMKKNLEDHEDGEAFPTGFAMDRDGQYDIFVFDRSMLNNSYTKDIIALTLLKHLKEHDDSVVAFCSDVFAGNAPASVDSKEKLQAWRETMPENMRDWPKEMRREMLVIAVNQMGELGESYYLPYEREGGKIVWGEPVQHNKGEGRFLYDLRCRDWRAVGRSIIERGTGVDDGEGARRQ